MGATILPKKKELESERYNLDLEPNTNFRDIWVIEGIQIWVMSLSFEFWDIGYEQTKQALTSFYSEVSLLSQFPISFPPKNGSFLTWQMAWS